MRLRCPWRSTELRERAGMALMAKRAKAKVRVRKALQRERPSRRQKPRMVKERPRKVRKRARASQMIDPEVEKERVTSSALRVESLATTQGSAGRTLRCEQFQVHLTMHRTTWLLSRLLFRDRPRAQPQVASAI